MSRKTASRWASVVLGVLLGGSVASAEAADEAAAKKAFDANKCSNCHAVEKVGIARKIQSEKMAGPDLSTVGDRHDAAWIVQYVQREVEREGKQHRSEYKGSKKDLEVIADWLASLKSES